MTKESIQLLIQTACETLQHTLFAGTTWVQAFSFLYFRVQFEMENGLSKINLISVDERLTLFFSALDEIINGKTIWTYNYCEVPYDSIKTTFFNTVLFLRIWLSLDGFSKMTAGSGIKFLSMWNKSDLLRDWSDIFSCYVEITPTKHIGFGTQMFFEDLTFDGINLTYACFEGSTFVNCVFNNVRLCNAIFSRATLKNVRFNECDLNHAEFSNASINDVDFTSSCLNNAILIQSSIVDAKWPKNTSNFSNLVFDKSEIARTAWKGSSIKTHSLSEVKFTECSFQSVSFPPILNGATFFNCSQKNSVFCTVNGLTFLGNSLVHTSVKFMKSINNCCFDGSTIDSFDCTRAIIDNVRFINVRLGDFSLRGATIKKFDFENCTVKGNIDATGATFGNAERAMLQSLTKNVTFH